MHDSQSQDQRILERQSQLFEQMSNFQFEATVLNPGPSLKYLTGLEFHLMERPVVAYFTQNKPVHLVLPALELQKLKDLSFQVLPFPYYDDPDSWGGVFREAALSLGLEGKIVGVEPTRLRFLEIQFLEASASLQLVSAAELCANLRIIKDEEEIAYIRRAVEIAQQGILATLPQIHTGQTEHQIASELTLQLLHAGSDPELQFSPIVSSGPNSANPHATPSSRKLQNGDLLVIDWGASYQGYISDLTRTFAIGQVDEEFFHIASIVEKANSAGRSCAAAEISAEEVDGASRRIIEEAGYGSFFTHRTGHGIGMEGHEAPYIRNGNSQKLMRGMTFTIEPGIYLPGRGGVRIEDDILITDNGSETLSNLPRHLAEIS